MKLKGLKIILLTLSLPVLLVSCGGAQKVVTDVVLDHKVIDDQSYIHIETKLDLNNITLFAFEAPIDIPGVGDVGTVKIDIDKIELDLNVSELIPQLETGGDLPNGGSIPLIGSNPVIVIPVHIGQGAYIDIYVSLVRGATTIGLSVPIKEFDELGKFGGYFPPFLLKGVTVAAGIFTSENAGESGLAAFFDVSEVLGLKVIDESTGIPRILVPMGGVEVFEFDMTSTPRSNADNKSLNKILRKLNRKKAVLNYL